MKKLRWLAVSMFLLAGGLAQGVELSSDHRSGTDGTLYADDGNAIAFATDIACGRDDPTDLVTCIQEMIDAGGAPSGTHLRYFGWSADRTIDASDFTAASTTTSMTDSGSWPATAVNAYPWFGVPSSEGYPTGLYRGGNPINQIVFFPQQAGTVTFDGETYVVGVSQSQLTASTSARPVRLEH